MMFSKSSRNTVIDIFRTIAILGVVGNHLMYPVASRGDFFGGTSWWLAFIIYTFSLVAVPIFIMISGYLLIDRNDSLEQNFKRTLNRLVIPLSFWFMFYLAWRIKFRAVLFSWSEIFDYIFSGNMFIYAFLVTLTGLYILLPIIQLIAKHGSKKLHEVIMYSSFLLTWFIGVTHYFSNLNGSVTTLTTLWLPFFSYFWWGFMVKKSKIERPGRFLALFISWMLATFAFGYAGFLLNTGNTTLAFKNGIFYWHDYLSPTVGLASIGLFTWLILSSFFKKLKFSSLVNKMIILLASLSYGVYLVHMFVIDYLDIKYRFAIEFIGSNLLAFVTIRPALAVVFSFIVCFIISKIPILKKIIGL